MSKRTPILIVAATSLAGGAALLWPHLQEASPPGRPETATPAPPADPITNQKPRPSPAPDPAPVKRTEQTKAPTPPPKVNDREQERRRRNIALWRRQSARFNHLLATLEHEQDPAKRNRLIHALAAYVRVDSLNTIEWATALANPDEQRAALNAISAYALNGIGARLTADPSGYPRIAETTVLSAVAATGQVESGDYIVGILDADGERVSFKDRPMNEVIQQLRGNPGSQVNLLIKQRPTDPDEAAIAVPVQRSMIVIVPPA